MLEHYGNNLSVELLNLGHLSQFGLRSQESSFKWLQILAVKGLIRSLENRFSKIIPTRQPVCLVAIENKKPIGFIVLKPINRKGTSWSISEPKIINSPVCNSTRRLKSCLLKSALKLESFNIKSFLTRCSICDVESLENSRNEGFQQLKVYTCWVNEMIQKKQDMPSAYKSHNEDYSWDRIKSSNVFDLWKLEQASEAVNLRQIVDRSPKDLFESKLDSTGAISVSDKSSSIVIAGFLPQVFAEEKINLKIVRDVAWDKRLLIALPPIINHISQKNKEAIIESHKEDHQINQLLEDLGWKILDEKILLGKNLLRRAEARKPKTTSSRLESMLGKLGPQTPPLPSPSLERH